MFWIGLIIAFLGGLISTDYSRRYLLEKLPVLTPRCLDISSLCCIIIGLCVSAYLYIGGQQSLKEQVKYNDIVQYNWHGFTTSDPRGGGFSTFYSGWTDDIKGNRKYVKMVYNSESHSYRGFEWSCDQNALIHYKEVIDKYPRFPFPYAVLALCMKEKGINGWRETASDGKKIFDTTATITGPHVTIYKDFKKRIDDALSSSD